MKNGFAGRIAETMRVTAPAKLRQLKVAHEMGAGTDMPRRRGHVARSWVVEVEAECNSSAVGGLA